MKTFLTTLSINDEKWETIYCEWHNLNFPKDTYAWPYIKANSWKEAQRIVDEEYNWQYIINWIKE